MKERPDVLAGKTIRARTECGSLFLTLNTLEGELFEIDITLGKSGTCVRALFNLISRLISIKLQGDAPKKDIVKFITRHCQGVSCGTPFVYKGESFKSCLDWVGKKIIEELKSEAV